MLVSVIDNEKFLVGVAIKFIKDKKTKAKLNLSTISGLYVKIIQQKLLDGAMHKSKNLNFKHFFIFSTLFFKNSMQRHSI